MNTSTHAISVVSNARPSSERESTGSTIVVPGDEITVEPGSLRGRGLLYDAMTGVTRASVLGTVERVNKLLFVRPLGGRYQGDVGDVVVGRIVETQNDRWLVEIAGTSLASLPLGGITLPSQEQRRRVDEDKLQMRDFFREGDWVAAEIQKITENSECVLHMRSGRYGNLFNGQVVKVSNSSLVKKSQQHVLEILINEQAGISVLLVLGCNGNIFVGAVPKRTGNIQNLNFSQVTNKVEVVSLETRRAIVQVRLAIESLSRANCEITVDHIKALLTG